MEISEEQYARIKDSLPVAARERKSDQPADAERDSVFGGTGPQVAGASKAVRRVAENRSMRWTSGSLQDSSEFRGKLLRRNALQAELGMT
jgi:hypothetical protein